MITWLSEEQKAYTAYDCIECGESFSKGEPIFLAKDDDGMTLKFCLNCAENVEVEEDLPLEGYGREDW